MNEDLLGYNEMVERAMRSVVREALGKAIEDDLPGDHHFYITFQTTHPDIRLPKSLHERYPEEMTIVLQNQFWNLRTEDTFFEVDLSFNQKMEQLHIPYSALITFADPSVNFGLQFHVEIDEDEDFELDSIAPPQGEATSPSDTETNSNNDDDSNDGDNVVTLDAFRKNK